MKPKGVPPVCTGNVRQIAGEVIGTREIVIDREFQSLLVPLSKAELSELRESILRDGCRDALVVWRRPDGKNVLLDGHCVRRAVDQTAEEGHSRRRRQGGEDSGAEAAGRRGAEETGSRGARQQGSRKSSGGDPAGHDHNRDRKARIEAQSGRNYAP